MQTTKELNFVEGPTGSGVYKAVVRVPGGAVITAMSVTILSAWDDTGSLQIHGVIPTIDFSGIDPLNNVGVTFSAAGAYAEAALTSNSANLVYSASDRNMYAGISGRNSNGTTGAARVLVTYETAQ